MIIFLLIIYTYSTHFKAFKSDSEFLKKLKKKVVTLFKLTTF